MDKIPNWIPVDSAVKFIQEHIAPKDEENKWEYLIYFGSYDHKWKLNLWKEFGNCCFNAVQNSHSCAQSLVDRLLISLPYDLGMEKIVRTIIKWWNLLTSQKKCYHRLPIRMDLKQLKMLQLKDRNTVHWLDN